MDRRSTAKPRAHSHSNPDIEAQLLRFTEACRERGMPVTHQRLAVLRALLESESHPDAEALHRTLRGAYPTLSLGTIYKTLEMLQSLGLARAVSSPEPTRRFDGNQDPHHHLWCTRCHRLTDVELDGLGHIALPAGLGFQVTAITIQFNGICASCRALDARTAPQDKERARASSSAPKPPKGVQR
ncbi:MAG: Fur family transcriptional regulator [Candidatus Eiseniibacteriota bacterium]